MTNPITEILHWADTSPDAAAIVSDRARLDFGELADAVRRSASGLRRAGLRSGDVIAVRAQPEWAVVLQLALLHEGAVSLHGSDAVLDAWGSAITAVLDDGSQPLPTGGSGVRRIDVGASFLAGLGAVRPAADPHPLAEGDLVRIVFSSGTTGRPKGVPFTVGLTLARIASAQRHWMPADPFVSLLGVDTVSGFQTVIGRLLAGKAAVLPGDGAANARLLSAVSARSIKTSPARLADLLDALEEPDAPTLSVEFVQVAGSLLSATLARRCHRLLGVEPTYLYGSTEAGTVTRGTMDIQHPARVGVVVDDAQVEIVDDRDKEVTSGQVGTVRIRTPNMPSQYWHGGPEVNGSFRDGWFYPGDRGRVTLDGQLEIVGRADDLVNAGGAKIELAELDLWLAELPLVREIASFSFQDENGLVAVGVAYSASRSIEPRLVHDRVQALIPMVDVRAVLRVDQLPRNATGKVLRSELTARLVASRRCRRIANIPTS